jgi:hypothetical protein
MKEYSHARIVECELWLIQELSTFHHWHSESSSLGLACSFTRHEGFGCLSGINLNPSIVLSVYGSVMRVLQPIELLLPSSS